MWLASTDPCRSVHHVMGATPSRATGPRADAVRFRHQILKTAVRVLRSDPNASLDQVATSAGVHRATLYRHFPNRQALVDAVFAQALEEARSIVARADAMAPSVVAVEALAKATVRYAQQYSFFIGAPEAPAAGSEQIGLSSLMASWQRAGVLASDVSADWLAAAFILLAEGLQASNAVPVRSRPQVLARTFLNGAAASSRSKRH